MKTIDPNLARQLGAKFPFLSATDPKTGQQIATPLLGYNAGPQYAEQMAEMGTLHAQAILEEIGRLGYTILPTSEADQNRVAAASVTHRRNRTPTMHCDCGTRLFQTRIRNFDTDHPIIHGPSVITALQRMSPECALNHQAAAS